MVTGLWRFMSDTKKISANRQKKVETVAGIKEKLEKAKGLFLTDYRGLTHQQMESLRKSLKKVEAEFIVAKNTLLKLALNKSFKDSKMQSSKEFSEQLVNELKNPTATLLAYGDEMAAIKALAAFIKNTQLPKIKIGLFGGNLSTEADFQKLASLPSRQILLATLVVRLNNPIFGLHNALSWNIRQLVYSLNAIKASKPQSSSN